jgi:hypothetical protein
MLPLISMTLAALLWLVGVTLGAATEPSFLPYTQWLHMLALALTTLAVVQVLHRLLSLALQRAKGAAGTATSDLLRAVLGIALYLVAGVLFLRHGLGLDVGNVVLTSAALSVIIGLALQPLLGHLFAGVSIELERKLRVGDHIRRDDLEGRVVSLSWRSVHLLTVRRSFLVMPNSEFTSRAIEVIPREQPYRHDVLFSVDANVSPGDVFRIGVQVLRSGLIEACEAPAPSVLLLSNDARCGTLNYTARFFTLDYLNRRITASQFLERFWYAMSREGLRYPVDYRNDDPYAASDSIPLPGLSAGLQQALQDSGRRQRYARGEKLDGDVVALVLQGTLHQSLPDEQQESAALQRLLAQLADIGGIGGIGGLGGKPGPSRLPQEQRLALIDDAKLVLGPIAHPLCERIAALTDDPFLAYHALAQSLPDSAHRAALLAKCPAHPIRLVHKGGWLGWTQALGLESQSKSQSTLESHRPVPDEAQAGNGGCELFVWARSDLRAALASATSADLKQLVAQVQAGTGREQALTLAGLVNWLCDLKDAPGDDSARATSHWHESTTRESHS